MNSIILTVAVLLLAISAPGTAYAQAVHHPLDALTVREVGQVVQILKTAGLVDDTTRYADISLREPPKADMWAWQPGTAFGRVASVVFRQGALTHKARVDITGATVQMHEALPGAETSILVKEWRMAQQLTLKSPKWQAAMQRRGIETFDGVFCSPISAGYFPDAGYDGRRIMKVPCYQTSISENHRYGRPIEGVFAIVDLHAKAVIEVVDTGIVPIPEVVHNYDTKPKTTFRAPLKPVFIVSPVGPNFKIKGGLEVEWQNWSFHTRFERRNGIVLSLVKFNANGKSRKIAYQMALSEMFVPYMDPDANWTYRTPLDAGEYGLGYLASSLRPGQDCPQQAVYITAVVPSDSGKVFPVPRAICIFERATGDPAWRHSENAGRNVESRPAIELVVRMIPTIGNYDYALDWVFTQHGNIKVRVGATGIIASKGVKSANMTDAGAAKDTAYGTLVAPHNVAPFHDHYFSYRLDLDVDGQNNTFLQGKITPRKLPANNPRRSIWTFARTPVANEKALGPRSGSWFLENANKRTALGHHPSLHIAMSHRITSPLAPDDPPQARAAFSSQSLWVTAYKLDEIYAAGDFPYQSKGGDGLPRWVASPEDITNKDIVLWPTIGFHHITRVEDWPIMATMWHELTIRPFNFFDENPAIDIPPGFVRPQRSQSPNPTQGNPLLRPGSTD